MAKKKGLGRGLESLLSPGGIPDKETPDLFLCPVEKIRPNPSQPRQEMDAAALDSLTRSIRENGVLQPLVVRETGEGYEIVCGERRWRAAQRAGLRRVPVVIKDVSPAKLLELALIENIQREDLNPIEEALAYKRLMHEFGLSQAEVARRVGRERSTVSNAIRLLRLPQDIQQDVAAGILSPGHARALLMVEDPDAMKSLRDEIVSKGLNVRQAEQAARRIEKKRAPGRQGVYDPDIARVEDELTLLSGLKARLKPLKKGGKIEFKYQTLEELEGFLQLLKR